MGGGGSAAGGASGASGGGQGGGAGAGGGGPATPSAGCSKGGGRPAGGEVSVANSHYFTFPEGYDGTKPYPVLIGFHGCGEVNRGTSLESTEWIRLTEDSAFKTEYVRFVPVSQSTGGCWTYNTDVGRVKDMYDDLIADHCVDTGRVFATGHSSGAQFVVQLLRQNSTADAEHFSLKAVAPVAASDYGVLAGPMPVMYIQGKTDMERGGGDGAAALPRRTRR
jgi:poly(3-hydroxybutyrate) depolymerase